MKIAEIYKIYCVPKNLQRHMLLVASLGKYILKSSKQIDDKPVVKSLLLHDIANLIKFDLDKGVHLFDKKEQDATFWKKIQVDMIEKYGKDEHIATLQIANDVGVADDTVHLIKAINSDNILKILKTNDFKVKVSVYCDFRANQDQYVTLRERFDDIIKRYSGRAGFMGTEKAIQKRDNCVQLEKQIEEKFDISLQNLNYLELYDIYKTFQEYDI